MAPRKVTITVSLPLSVVEMLDQRFDRGEKSAFIAGVLETALNGSPGPRASTVDSTGKKEPALRANPESGDEVEAARSCPECAGAIVADDNGIEACKDCGWRG